MRGKQRLILAGLVLTLTRTLMAQNATMSLPRTVVAGDALTFPTTAGGKAVIYIVGPGQALKRDVESGGVVSFPAGALYNAGHYLVILVGPSSTETGEFDIVAASKPVTLSLLARPSRLPVGLHSGISGAVYVFDAFHNLITNPMPASLELSNASSAAQTRNVTTRHGVAWTTMDSAEREGTAKLIARVGDISTAGIIDEVPGDPCRLTISARPNGASVEVQTAPIRDCGGNQIPDGAIVTFKETYSDVQSTVDVPIKRGIATINMPAHAGAKISVESGVVAGNEIRLGGSQ